MTVKPTIRLFGGIFGFCLSLATTPLLAGPAEDVQILKGWMNGQFSSAKQVEVDDNAKLRFVYATLVSLPQVPGEGFYFEWHGGQPDGPIDSQRIWAFEAMDDHIVMRFYTFYEKADAALTGIQSADDVDVDALAALTPGDFYSYPEDCAFLLKREGDVITGKNGTGACRIFNRSLDVWMRPDVTLSFASDGFNETAVYRYDSKANDSQPRPPLSVTQDFRATN